MLPPWWWPGFEPENHVLEIVQGYARSASAHPLIVVGAAPLAQEYTDAIRAAAQLDPRVRLLGRVDDQDVLDQLYANAMTYLHGHSVGGTNPSLLRAMGAESPVLALDVDFNREVAGETARFWSGPQMLPALLAEAEADPAATAQAGASARRRAAEHYRRGARRRCLRRVSPR